MSKKYLYTHQRICRTGYYDSISGRLMIPLLVREAFPPQLMVPTQSLHSIDLKLAKKKK